MVALRGTVEFDTFSLVLLEASPECPVHDPVSAEGLEEADLALLAGADGRYAGGRRLHPRGRPRAAPGDLPPPLPVEAARAIHASDPAVRAGCLNVRGLAGMVPRGAVAFETSGIPHSRSEV